MKYQTNTLCPPAKLAGIKPRLYSAPESWCTCIKTAIAIFKWQMACLNKRARAAEGQYFVLTISDLRPQVLF